MHGRDRVLTIATAAIAVGRVGNAVAVGFLATLVVLSVLAEPLLVARLTAKYGAGADVARIIWFLRAIALLAIPVGYAVERLLRALRAILASVAVGEPFAPANAGRLREIGWLLLAIQFVDLAFAAVTVIAARLGIEYASWQPSFTGWFATLVAFVLVRVFAAGTALRDDVAGTV